MDKTPSSESNQTAEPQAEVLVARSDDGEPTGETPAPAPGSPLSAPKKSRRRTYRPSHKATFIGLAVVVGILAVNAIVLSFLLRSKNKDNNQNDQQVTISKAALSKVGVNSSNLGDSGVVLTIGPNTQFSNKVTVASDVSIGGELKLNSKFTATDAQLNQLEAGKVSLSDLNVNGNGTLNALNLRNGLVVTGATQMQGPITANQLATFNNSVIVVGNLSVGGTLSTRTFSATNLTSTGTLTIGGHVITNGGSPSVSRGGAALGNNGTVSIGGNDSAGQININIGTGAGSGILANVAFRTNYASPPHVVVTPVGVACPLYVANLTVGGFSVGDGCNMPPGGYLVEYIVMQ